MSFWILDTDHASLLLNEHRKIGRRVAQLNTSILITVVTAQELFNGWTVKINNAKEIEDLVRFYSQPNRTLELYRSLQIAQFDKVAGDRYTQLLMPMGV